jgi:Heme oxygenase
MLYSKTSSLHQQLKSATQPIHDALHDHPLMRRLMEPECSLADYRSILEVFQRFYAEAEARFNSLAPKFDGEAPVLAWLRQDFCAIGGGDDVMESRRDSEKKKADFSSYLGYLYVKQGSTLGGQVLSRRLGNTLGLSPERGLRFFSSFGENTRQNWLYFLRYLEEQLPIINEAAAVASACECFLTLEIMLNEAAVETVC